MALVVIGIGAGFLTLLLTPYLRDLFIFLQIVDKPDAYRRIHREPTPRIGGIPIAIAYLAALLLADMVLTLLPLRGFIEAPHAALLLKLAPGALVVFITGLADDVFGISAWQKLAGQVAAGALTYWGGIRMAPWPVPYADWVMPVVAVGWLVFCANAFNLIDGLDGLAAGVAFIATSALMVISLIHGYPALTLAITPLLGGLAGFLYHNFNPATVFLGDCGSLFIGFLFGCFALLWAQQPHPGLIGFAPLFAMLLPVAEVVISIIRRLLRSKHVFAADRNHIHHRLLLLGLEPWAVALTLYGVSITAAVFAVIATVADGRITAVLFATLIPTAFFALRSLRYEEFSGFRRWLAHDVLQSLRLRICLEDYRNRLNASRTLEERWAAMMETARVAHLESVELATPEGSFRTPAISIPQPCETVRMSLRHGGSLRVQYRCDRPELSAWIAPLAVYFEQSLDRPLDITETVRARAHAAGARD